MLSFSLKPFPKTRVSAKFPSVFAAAEKKGGINLGKVWEIHIFLFFLVVIFFSLISFSFPSLWVLATGNMPYFYYSSSVKLFSLCILSFRLFVWIKKAFGCYIYLVAVRTNERAVGRSVPVGRTKSIQLSFPVEKTN